MAYTKAQLFEREDIDLAALAKALSHPARIAILKKLARDNVCICGELVTDLPLAQSTVSQHLSELKKVRLIKGDIDGAKSCYCIDRTSVKRLARLLENLFEEFAEGCSTPPLITIKEKQK